MLAAGAKALRALADQQPTADEAVQDLVTGLVEALNAGSPMVIIVGDAHREHAGKHMTQETHQIEILRPAVKEVLRIESVARIPELLRRLCQRSRLLYL